MENEVETDPALARRTFLRRMAIASGVIAVPAVMSFPILSSAPPAGATTNACMNGGTNISSDAKCGQIITAGILRRESPSRVSVFGLTPNCPMYFFISRNHQYIANVGVGTTDSSGRGAAEIVIPSSVASGVYTLQVDANSVSGSSAALARIYVLPF